jgi:hypothetical protein
VLKEKDMLPEHLVGHDILVLRVEGDMNFSAASTLRRILSAQFKERLGKSDINSLVFDFTVPICGKRDLIVSKETYSKAKATSIRPSLISRCLSLSLSLSLSFSRSL